MQCLIEANIMTNIIHTEFKTLIFCYLGHRGNRSVVLLDGRPMMEEAAMQILKFRHKEKLISQRPPTDEEIETTLELVRSALKDRIKKFHFRDPKISQFVTGYPPLLKVSLEITCGCITGRVARKLLLLLTKQNRKSHLNDGFQVH